MPIWSAAPVAEAPADELTDCAVFDLSNGHRHLAVWSCRYREGRATSAVVAFDAAQLSAVTRSGRVYQLRCRPGLSSDAEYMWRRWCGFNDVDPEACRHVARELL